MLFGHLLICNRQKVGKAIWKNSALSSPIISTLFKKTVKAAEKFGIKQIVLGGGVAANSEIRRKFFSLQEKGYKIFAPEMKYCTDNASMIASSAYFLANTMDSLEIEVFSRC